MRIRKRGVWAVLMALILILAGIPLAPSNEAEAAKKMKLSKTKLSLKVGKTKKLTVKNKKKKAKVTWTTSKKKVATVSKKGVVKAKKAGKATITAKVRYKKKTTKLKCKVTVTKKKKTTKSTPQPKVTPTPKPTAKPTVKPTAKPVSDVPDPAKAKKWDSETMGGFYVSGIRFADDSLTYQMESDSEGNGIFLDFGNKYMDVKAAVPDLTKCSFEVYAGGKSYKKVTVGDIQWKNADGGYYVFTLYINVDGTTYSSVWKMKEYDFDRGNYTDELLITSIKTDKKTIIPQKDLRSESNHYMIDPAGASVKEDLPDLKKAEFTAVYLGKEVTIEKIGDVRWRDTSYYDTWDQGTGYYFFDLYAKNGAERMRFHIYLSDYKDQLDVYQYSYQMNGKEKKEPIAEYNDILSVDVPEGKTLKEVFPDLSASFTFECLYRDTVYRNIKPADVKWVAESFHENKCDKGYYTFTLSATVGGKTITRALKLVETYRGITYEVSGKLYAADNTSPAGQELRFWNKGGDDCTVTTAADGTYKVRLQEEDTYYIYWNQCQLDSQIKMGNKAMTYDIRTDMRKASGIITRLGKPMADCDIRFDLDGYRFACCHTDSKGAYSVYLPESGGAQLVLYKSVEALLEEDEGNYLTGWDQVMLEKIHKNNNIDSKRVKVSGTIYRKGTTPLAGERCAFSSDNGGTTFTTEDDGSYEIYLDPNQNYELWIDNHMVEMVKTGSVDQKKDFNLGKTKIRGMLKTKSGNAMPNTNLYFYSDNKEEPAGDAYTDSRGKYSVTLKPGTYTVKAGWTETELEQRLTVGTEDRIMDLETPFYKVSMLVYNNNENWKDRYRDLTVVTEDGDMEKEVYVDDDGRYTFYAPAGKYICNILNSDDNAKTITVDRDLEQELRFTYQKVTGNIYRLRAGNWFERITDENYGVYMTITDDQGNPLQGITTWGGPNSDYEVYLPGAGDYKVVFKGEEVYSFTTDSRSEITQDLVCEIYRVSGMVTGIRGTKKDYWNNWLYFSPEEDGWDWDAELGDLDTATGKQSYTIFLPAGEYYYYAEFDDDNIKRGSMTVSGDKTNEDIDLPVQYKISGKVTRMSQPWEGLEISCQSDDCYRSMTTRSDGSYECYVPAGEYNIYLYGMSNFETITVSDKDVSKDFSFDQVRISGTLTRNGEGLGNVAIQIAKGEENLGGYSTDGDGAYAIYVDPNATYKLSVLGMEKTVTVAEEDLTQQDIAVTATKVSGILTESDGTPSAWETITIYQKNQDGMVEKEIYFNTDEEGRFEGYLPAGTYYINYMIESENGGLIVGEHGAFTVGAEDMTYNIQKKTAEEFKHTVTGTLAGMSGTPFANMEIVFDKDNGTASTVTTDENGMYEVTLGEGYHTISITGIDIWSGDVTVGVEDMVHDISLEHIVSISGKVTQDGTPISGLSLVITREEKPMGTCLTREDGSYTFYVWCNSEYKIIQSETELGTVTTEQDDITGHDLTLPSKN